MLTLNRYIKSYFLARIIRQREGKIETTRPGANDLPRTEIFLGRAGGRDEERYASDTLMLVVRSGVQTDRNDER